MALTVVIPDDVQERLLAEAERRGESPDSVVAALLRELPDSEASPEAPAPEDIRRAQAIFNLGEQYRGRNLPGIALEELRRAHLYAESDTGE